MRECKFIFSDIQTCKASHELLSRFACYTQSLDSDITRLTIDMSKVSFIAANQFAVLGSILDDLSLSHPNISIQLYGLAQNIKNIMGKNGFCKNLNLPRIPDVYNTTIPYKVFDASYIDEYEKYLTINLFNRSDLPKMSEKVRDNIRDYLLEIFKNVIDHTNSKKIYTCGQFFPKTALLYFTLVDIGETIRYNVSNFHRKYGIQIPDNALIWALQEGNTTIDVGSPRGLGLSLIQSFVKLNNGQFFIISVNETYEITQRGNVTIRELILFLEPLLH